MAPQLLPQRWRGAVPSGRIGPTRYLQPASVRRGWYGPSLAASSMMPPVGYFQPLVCRCRCSTGSAVAPLYQGGRVHVFGLLSAGARCPGTWPVWCPGGRGPDAGPVRWPSGGPGARLWLVWVGDVLTILAVFHFFKKILILFFYVVYVCPETIMLA